MQLSFEIHPQFLFENAKALWELFLEDQTFRYLELRKRLRIELKMTLESESISEDSSKLLQLARQALGEVEEDLSWIEQALLAESHERWRSALVLVDLERVLKATAQTEDRYLQAARMRLQEISQLIRDYKLSDHPNWLSVLRYRWTMEPLRKEGAYLCKVLDQNHKDLLQ